MTPLAMWGGIECTVNRVGDGRIDQLDHSGHAERDDDIDRMAALGIRTWRYPVLWERVAPRGIADWSFTDRRLGRMRANGLEPIAGLVHHGSGPDGTSLLDPEFPEKLAGYAHAVAERYPWITRWTPINEPLSTARFSALDGHWYPHRTSERDFAQALFNESRAIVLAMRAIRTVVPAAELVFTEDVCRHFATPALQDEADFRNHRRFLAIDLVLGRVGPHHPLYGWLVRAGISADALAALEETPTPPAIIGANYYVTSDRFLDESPMRVPAWRRFHGPLGAYGETEAVRVTTDGLVGHRALLTELWHRYRLPLAITEVHLGCTREEQARWLVEAWDAAMLTRADGVDVRAVTAWGAFGLFGWDQLVVRTGGTYEPGMFDVRGPAPRRTALATIASDLAAGRAPEAPWGGPGWWRRPARTLGRPAVSVPGRVASLPLPAPRPARPVLVTGGGAFAREVWGACRLRGLAVVAPGRSLDVADPDAVALALDDVRPWAVFHAVGVRDRAAGEEDPARTSRLHTLIPTQLAVACEARGVRLATLSSSLVLPVGGSHGEHALRAPRSALGTAQADAEERVRARHPNALVLRCGTVVDARWLSEGLAVLRDQDRWILEADASAVVASLLAHAGLDLLVDGEAGLWHLTQRRPLLEIARFAAREAGFDPARVRAEGGAVRLHSDRGHLVAPCGATLRALVVRARPRAPAIPASVA